MGGWVGGCVSRTGPALDVRLQTIGDILGSERNEEVPRLEGRDPYESSLFVTLDLDDGTPSRGRAYPTDIGARNKEGIRDVGSRSDSGVLRQGQGSFLCLSRQVSSRDVGVWTQTESRQ